MAFLKKYTVLAAFAAFILGFSAWDMVKPAKTFSEFENRYLKQRPQFSLKNLLNNTYTKKYEEFINDQFVFRNEWITLKSVAESGLGKIENNGVVYGKDDYLFEKYNTVPEEQLAKNIKFVREFLEAYPDLPVTLGIIPNSYMVLEDKLPAGLSCVDQYARTEEIYEQIAAGNDGLTTLDLSKGLEAHRDEYIYYRTDHHWTTLGAYYSYAQYVESLGRTPVSLEELEPHLVEDFYGTYFSKTKNFDAVPDTITWYDIPAEVTIDGKAVDGYYDLEKFETRDKYAAFMRGNNGLTVMKSRVNRDAKPGETSKVLLIKDSYGNSFAPYLLFHFDEVHVVDLRSLTVSMEELLRENQYEDVLLLYNFRSFAQDNNILRLRY